MIQYEILWYPKFWIVARFDLLDSDISHQGIQNHHEVNSFGNIFKIKINRLYSSIIISSIVLCHDTFSILKELTLDISKMPSLIINWNNFDKWFDNLNKVLEDEGLDHLLKFSKKFLLSKEK